MCDMLRKFEQVYPLYAEGTLAWIDSPSKYRILLSVRCWNSTLTAFYIAVTTKLLYENLLLSIDITYIQLWTGEEGGYCLLSRR